VCRLHVATILLRLGVWTWCVDFEMRGTAEHGIDVRADGKGYRLTASSLLTGSKLQKAIV
jgi:hypothetical protein